MNSKYSLSFSAKFARRFDKLVKRNKSLRAQVVDTLALLRISPFCDRLGTHKVHSKLHGKVYSSSVNGDVRILWDFNQKIPRILDIMDLGGHSGSQKVYK